MALYAGWHTFVKASAALRGVVAQPKITPVSGADTSGEVNGLSRDAIEEQAELNIQLALAAKVGLVGTFAYDADTEVMQSFDGYTAIHGFPEGTREIPRNECLAGMHPDDIGRVEQFRTEAFRERRREYNVEYRIIRPGGELRWVETHCFISFGDGRDPQRVVGVSIDVTERKRVEEQQRTLLAELDHRVKNVLATVQAVAAHTMQA
ncbi:MAG: PAS domain-containing protein, partial [Hyphomicrobiaceae bacterium]